MNNKNRARLLAKGYVLVSYIERTVEHGLRRRTLNILFKKRQNACDYLRSHYWLEKPLLHLPDGTREEWPRLQDAALAGGVSAGQ